MISPFGSLPVAAGVNLVVFESAVGPLTAFRAPAEGERRGTVLFVHGFTGSKEDFRLLAPAAARQGWDAVAYTQRGQADSAAPIGIDAYRLSLLAADATHIADQLAEEVGEGTRIHLVGHSLGGLVARAAVVSSPETFASLTLLCSGPGGRPGVHQSDGELVVRRGLLALVGEDDDAFTHERFAASSVENYLAGVDILQHTVDVSGDLAATGVPVLVAHGDTDDAWPIADQRAMATRLGARYEVIPNAGHLPNLDNPKFTTTLLAEFWASTANSMGGRR